MAIAMMRGLVATLEQHHKVRILDEAVSEAVRLSARYIPRRQLPDKAVSLIDTACARVAMSQNAIPAPIDDRQRRIGLIDTELKILEREMAAGRRPCRAARRTASPSASAPATSWPTLQKRWEAETRHRDRDRRGARAASRRAGGQDGAGDDRNGAAAATARPIAPSWRSFRRACARCRARQPLIFPVVDGQAIAEIVEGWTGIPAGRMQSDEIRTVLNLREAMERRVIGQSARHGSRRASHPHQRGPA